MLPSALFSVYQQYKADTDALAGWLAVTAKTANCPAHLLGLPARSPTGRLKGKERKLAKEQASKPKKSVLAIRLFVPLAKHIVSARAPRIPVPQSVINITERVIHERSAFSSRLSYHGAMPSVEGDESHSYFVDILKQVLCNLQENVVQQSTSPEEASHSSEIENQFASLRVHEPSQAFLNAPDVELPAADNNIVYEAEQQTTLDDSLAAYRMLLQDLNNIRHEIKQIWSDCSQGSIEISAAALATNTGIDLARYLIDQVLPLIESHQGIADIAETFTLQLAQKQNLANDDDGSEDIYQLVDETLFVANNFMKRAACCKECARKANEPWNETSDAVRELLVKAQDRVEEDVNILSEIFKNMFVDKFMTRGYLMVDEGMRGLVEMDPTSPTPFYVTFAFQVTLDIHHTLGDWVTEPAQQLDKELNFTSVLIEDHYQDRDAMDKMARRGCGCLRNFKDKILHFQTDPTVEARKEAFKRFKTDQRPSEERHRSMQLSPVLCGLTIFYFRAAMHDFGFSEFNRSRTIKHAVHLYNALVKEGMIESPWIDMQLAENFFGRSNIFAGEKPSSTAGYLKQLMLEGGMSILGLNKLFGILEGHSDICGERSKKKVFRSKSKRNVNCGAPVSSIFIERYHDHSGRIDYRPEDVEEIISRRRFTDAAASSSKRNRHPPHTLLRPLAEALTEESLEVAFPRLLMYRICGEFLNRVEEECTGILEECLDRLPELSRATVFAIFSYAVSDGNVGKSLMSKAASIVNETVASGSGNRVIDVMENEFGLRREWMENVCSESKLAEGF